MIKNILLVEPKSPEVNIFTLYKIPRMGAVLLGTLAKQAGYNVKVIYCEATPLRHEHIDWADMVGFSITTSTAPEGYRLAKLVQALNYKQGIYRPIIFGGVHATFRAEEALEAGDYVFRGEADTTFVPFLGALNSELGNRTGSVPDTGISSLEEIPGLTYRAGDQIIHNPLSTSRPVMDDIPSPDWSLFEDYNLRVGVSMTSRGCPYDCSFCSVTPMFGREYRKRSIDMIMEDLAASTKKNIFFYDDHFTADKKRAKELLKRIISEYGKSHRVKRFSAQVRSDIARDPELLDLMKKAGFTTLFIGFESVNPQTLELYNKKQNVDEIMQAIKTIHEHKIRIHGMFVFGSDADTRETFEETVRFARRARLETVQFLILTPLPGSRQYQSFASENRILSHEWSRYDAFNAVYLPKKLSPYELQHGMLAAMKKFYSLPSILSWLLRGRPLVFAFQLYGFVTLRLWILHNRRRLRGLKRESREIFLPEMMQASCPGGSRSVESTDTFEGIKRAAQASPLRQA